MFGDNHDDGEKAEQSDEEENQTYGFVSEPEDEEVADEEEDDEATTDGGSPTGVERWSLGEHSTADSDTVENIQQQLDSLDDEVDGDVKGVLEEAASMLSSTSVSDFECPVCGLNHGHSDTKHDIRRSTSASPIAGFAIFSDFAEEMEMNPWCHCGANEAAMLVDFFGYFDMPMFADQHHFESVLELPNEVVQSICQKMQELERTAVREVVIEDAIEEAGYEYEVPEDVVPDLARFYDRWSLLKDGASSAPISGEARNTIEEKRAELESYVA